MTRTVAIVLTVFTVVCCGLPGLGLLCISALAGLGSQMPEFANQAYSPEELGLGIGLYLCGGLVLLLIPVIVGIVSFRVSRPHSTPAQPGDDMLPPAS